MAENIHVHIWKAHVCLRHVRSQTKNQSENWKETLQVVDHYFGIGENPFASVGIPNPMFANNPFARL